MAKCKNYPFPSHILFGRQLDEMPKMAVFGHFSAIYPKMAENRVFSAILVKKCPSGTGILAKMSVFDTRSGCQKPFYFLQ